MSGKSYIKRRSPENLFPELPEAGLHKSVREKETLSEGLRKIGFPERPEVGLHQSVWEKVSLSEGLRLLCQPRASCNGFTPEFLGKGDFR